MKTLSRIFFLSLVFIGSFAKVNAYTVSNNGTYSTIGNVVETVCTKIGYESCNPTYATYSSKSNALTACENTEDSELTEKEVNEGSVFFDGNCYKSKDYTCNKSDMYAWVSCSYTPPSKDATLICSSNLDEKACKKCGSTFDENEGCKEKYDCKNGGYLSGNQCVYSATTESGYKKLNTFNWKYGNEYCSFSKYYIKYPGKKRICSTSENKILDVTGFEFSTNTGIAYCVNPGLAHSGADEYGIIEEFDASQCENSLQSKNCGYANIMIEAERLGYNNYGIVSTALRLWAAYGEGYDDRNYGILRDRYNENNVGMPTNIMEPIMSEKENIYINTVEKILSGSYSSKSIYEVKSLKDLHTIACNINDNNSLGVMCGGDLGYLKSIYLFLNTYQGNNQMQENLKSISGSDANENIVTDIQVSVDIEKGEAELIFEIDEETFVDCSEDANKSACEQNIYIEYTLMNENGEVEKQIYDFADKDAYFDKCSKGFCTKTIKFTKRECKNTKTYKTIFNVKTSSLKTKQSRKISRYWHSDNTQDMMIWRKTDVEIVKNEIEKFTDDFNYNIYEEKITIEPCSECEQDECIITGNEIYYKTANMDSLKKTTSSDGIINQCYGATKFEADVEYDTYATSIVGDPSMNCILNVCYESSKAKYDYSEEFGVNTDVCRVYCRDEVKFYLANKTKVYAGMQFRYDIVPKINISSLGRNSEEYKLTSIVLEQRECASEIYLNKVNSNGKTWIDLYNDAIDHKNEKTATQLVYDLANCNMYTNEQIDTLLKTIDRSNYEVAFKIKENNATKSYSSYSYYLENLGDKIKYDNEASLEINYEEGEIYDNPTMSKETDNYITSPKYCINTGSNDCFGYLNKKDVDFGIKEKTTTSLISKLNSNLTSLIGDVTIPINDYAIFTIANETDFYNNSKYMTERFNGDVQIYDNNVYSNDKHVILSDFVYPVSKMNNDNYYPIEHFYDITLFERNNKSQLFKNVLNEISKYTCSYDVYNTIVPVKPVDYEYRNIDLKNMFPTDREYGTNWTSKYAKEIVSEIESKADNIFVDEKLIEYSFTLTTDTINKIKNDYNSLHKSYLNETLYDCETDNGMFLNCKSKFLRDTLKSWGVEYTIYNNDTLLGGK